MDKETAEKAFDDFDQDKSGKVDPKELENVVKAFHEMMGETVDADRVQLEVKAILAEVDTSGDGKIDKTEFVKFFTAPM